MPDLPLGPEVPTLFWQLQGILNPLSLLRDAHDRYGDIFRLPYADFTAICVSSPTGLQSIFSASSEVLSSHQRGGIFDLILGQNSLLFLEGREHQRHRRLIVPPFHGEALGRWGREICRTTQYVLDQPQYQTVLPLRQSLKEVALRVMLQVLFGGLRTERLRELYRCLYDFFQGVESPLSAVGLLFPALRLDLGNWSPWGQFLQHKQRINQLIQQQIDRQRASTLIESYPSVLAMLLQVRDELGQPLNDDEIRDELLTLVLAGYETTTSAIAWALYWVHQDPTVQEKLRRELDGVADPMEIARLPYLSAVCHEVLRIYPVAIGCFARQVLQPFSIDGYQLPIGTVLSPSIYLAHHRKTVYPEPDAFRPERFLSQQFSAYEYLPFGGGSRRCVGGEFTKFEIKLIVATVLKQMQLEPFDSRPVFPVRYGITMAPPIDLQLKVVQH